MPSIEIICLNQTKPCDFSAMPFQVYAENELVSHRIPSPLFQADFNGFTGCIYHLCKHRHGAYNTGDLLTEWWDTLIFKEEYVPYVKQLLETLLTNSPAKQLLFTSDYQFGPEEKRYKSAIKLSRFWKIHDEGKLRANALYPIRE